VLASPQVAFDGNPKGQGIVWNGRRGIGVASGRSIPAMVI
jgi:hypothetical protein